ncbi:1,3-beta-glucanosyltransferase [Roridomyces roridus]|uniref:1,3-beta-glucanosyltransferase n=1 Tax=Roridomyces roridus TaxID=1738132 RepID=A0AAD7BCR7_9AGAR|nr:1,3-beta-glucanosyltransferase [Roridomyces roridus]
MKLHAAVLASLGFAASVNAIAKVTRTGRYLYTDDGNRFYLKGIAYQTQGQIISGPDNPLNQPSTFVDNLADDAGCARDIPNLQALGANAIRAYSVDSTLNHDSCMNALSSAGIYVIIDLTLPLNGSIDTTQPSWSTNLLNQYINTINVFNKYDNVLAYNVGNEVLTSSATNAAPFLKAAARDIKTYLASIKSSALVGYADIDGASSFRDAVSTYLSCDPTGSNSDATSIDIFGLNNYEWCGNDSTSTYDGINGEFQNYNVVAYFSEFGSENCNPVTRPWTEVGTLFASPMTNVWSGGLAFSYFSAQSQGHEFGMVTLSSDNKTTTTNADWDNLLNQYKQVSFVNSPSQSSAPASSFGACPQEGATLAASSTLPATPNQAACQCLQSSLPCLFKPPTPDYNVLLGTLTGVVCGLLPGVQGDCSDIAANGTTGTYGAVSGCDPTIKLSYAFSQYFELTGKAETSCDFSGNATLVSNNVNVVPSAAVASCVANPSATFTPSASAPASSATGGSSSSGGGGGSSSSGGGGGSTGGALSFAQGPIVGLAAAAACVVWGAMWTLL